MPPISMLIKPVSGLCNLNCKYCFYHDVAENRLVKSYGMMSEELLEMIVRKAITQSEGMCSFAFQGGEPTLAGLGFYEKLIEFQDRYNTKNIHIVNSIQTNGVAIDSSWAVFFKKHGFLVGMSLDGDERIHNAYRVFNDGSGSFAHVKKAAGLLDRYNVEYNILSVVTAQSCEYTEHIYNYFKSTGFKYLQFIPCLDPLNEERGRRTYSLTSKAYEIFLKKLFDCWYRDLSKGKYISIRFFDNLVNMALGNPPENCAMNGICCCYYTIEADGSVYPCDFYVLDEFKLGNIQDRGFKNLINQPAAKKFIEQSMLIHEKCSKCKYYAICRGGCRRDRINNLTDNYFCDALYSFFDYSLVRIQEIAEKINLLLKGNRV